MDLCVLAIVIVAMVLFRKESFLWYSGGVQVDVILPDSLIDDDNDDDDDGGDDSATGIDYKEVEAIVPEVVEILKLAPYRMIHLFSSF